MFGIKFFSFFFFNQEISYSSNALNIFRVQDYLLITKKKSYKKVENYFCRDPKKHT